MVFHQEEGSVGGPMLGEQAPVLSAVSGVSHRFFSSRGGTSPRPWRGLNVSATVGDAPGRVEENLARCRFQIGVERRALFTVTQVHGDRVVVVEDEDDPDEISPVEADAILTSRPGVAVAVRTADCAPILMAARDGRAVGAVHAGWRGAVGGVIQAAVRGFVDLGVPPADLIAVVGPCIGRRVFEVGPEVVEQAAAAAGDIGGLVAPGAEGKLHISLAGLCMRLLTNAGVAVTARVGSCTFETVDNDGSVYFSHRRDKGRTGRQLSAIARVEPPALDAAMFR